MNCPKCMQQFEGTVCPYCQASTAQSTNPYHALGNEAPPPYQQNHSTPDQTQTGDATGGVIPYKNPKALVAYYLGIVSGLPLIGLPFGIAAFVLGILGLKARKHNPDKGFRSRVDRNRLRRAIHSAVGVVGYSANFQLAGGAALNDLFQSRCATECTDSNLRLPPPRPSVL